MEGEEFCKVFGAERVLPLGDDNGSFDDIDYRRVCLWTMASMAVGEHR